MRNKIISIVHVNCKYLKKTESYPSRKSKCTIWAFTSPDRLTLGSTLRAQSKCHVGTCMKMHDYNMYVTYRHWQFLNHLHTD